jgi:hypothetical protein
MSWKIWWNKWQGSELLPIIPPNAPLKEGSKVKPEYRGKTPGFKTAEGWVGLGGKWSDTYQMDRDGARRADKWGAGIGLQGRIFPAIDIDVEDPQLAGLIEKLAFDILGPAPVRGREGSARRLLMYRIEDGEIPFRKRRLPWTGAAVELLGKGSYYNVEGLHPKGMAYRWDEHPCVKGPDSLSPITKEKLDKFFVELTATLGMFGIEPKPEKTNTSATTRKSLDDPSLHASSPELVIEALGVWENDLDSHDDFVTALAAVKAALGPRREEFYGDVEAWALGYGGNDEAYIRKTWESIKDAAVGADWLFSQARRKGFHGDAQVDFAEGNSDAEASAQIPETAFDKMLQNYIWCDQVERFVDVRTYDFLNESTFAKKHTDVAPYGSSGTKTAAAQFFNSVGARKAERTTYRPGQGIFIDEVAGIDFETKKPLIIKAVNLWKPSLLVPIEGGDISPWLEHVEKIFGPIEDPAAQHFLNWCAFKLQRRGEKINHAPVIVGPVQGTGKDTVLMPVQIALGPHNVATISPDTLSGQWTHYLRSELVITQELHNFEKRATNDRLKPMIASPPLTVEINMKNVKQYTIPNIQCWWFYTNHLNALPLEDSDRRFWVHHVEMETPPPKEYFNRIYRWYKLEQGYEKVAGWLMQRPMSDEIFNPMAAPPMTQGKKEMIEAGLSPQERWCGEQIMEGGPLHGRQYLMAMDIMRLATGYDVPENVRPHHAAAALRRAGYRASIQVRLPDEKPHTMWVTPEAERRVNATPHAHRALVAWYQAEDAGPTERKEAA